MTDESWERLPEARIRMRPGGLELLVKSLQEDGMFIADAPTVRLLEDGVYITLPTQAGKVGSVVFLGLDIFIPVKDLPTAEPAPEPAIE